MSLKRVNVFALDIEYDASDPEGFRGGMNRFGALVGASMMGATVYELPPGQSNCPYHYEYGNEEWLLGLDGVLTIRHPEGEDELERGDIVCFPAGPDGAHDVRGPARVLIVSANQEPSISVYPDGDKLGTRPAGADDPDWLNFRRRDAVDYWEGES